LVRAFTAMRSGRGPTATVRVACVLPSITVTSFEYSFAT
jgi:hypothetical protein